MLIKQSITLVLTGSIPSKKNSRINTRSGKSFPSKSFEDWQVDSIQDIRTQSRIRFYNPVCIDIVVFFTDLKRADLDNRVTSILDMLVEAFVLKDDKWQDVPQITVRGEYRKNGPGAVIGITEL